MITIKIFFAVVMFFFALSPAMAQQKEWMIRMAKIEIDSNYITEYRDAIKEHTKAALANEPGVLTLYAVYDKVQPTKVTVLEIYASTAAYQHHIKTPHFLKYKNGTLKMVKSLELIDVDPIAFGAKPDILKLFK
jgi:quinol monooxygenase YgiN